MNDVAIGTTGLGGLVVATEEVSLAQLGTGLIAVATAPEILAVLGLIAVGAVIVFAVSKIGSTTKDCEKKDEGEEPSPSDDEKPTPKKGSAKKEGAGKPFSKATKEAARKESGNKCTFCGKETTPEPGPDQSNIDHAIPKSRGGDNSIDNAQNTCRTCNLDKSAQTTEEYLDSLKK